MTQIDNETFQEMLEKANELCFEHEDDEKKIMVMIEAFKLYSFQANTEQVLTICKITEDELIKYMKDSKEDVDGATLITAVVTILFNLIDNVAFGDEAARLLMTSIVHDNFKAYSDKFAANKMASETLQ